MKLIPKLGLGFLALVLSIWLFGSLTIKTSIDALSRALSEHAVTLNMESLDILERDIFRKINHFREFLLNPELRKALSLSNQEFGEMKDVQAYINEKDREWRSAGKKIITPFEASLIDAPVSRLLRDKMVRYEEVYGEKNAFAEVFVTNQFGGNIAQTGKTTDYRQDDELWWQEAEKSGIVIEGMDFDESSETTALSVGIRAQDDEGRFAGVIKVVLNIQGLLNSVKELELRESSQGAKRFMIDPKGEVEYADVLTDARNVRGRGFFKKIKGAKGYFTAPGYLHSGRSFFAYTLSEDRQNFKNLGWYLITEYPEEKIFEPVRKLRLRLLIALAFLSVMAVMIALVLSRAITFPLGNLRDAVTEFGKGNFDFPLRVVTKDEIGQVTAAFKKMILDLRRSTTSIESLNREIEKRAKTEAELKDLHEKHVASHRAVKNMLYDLTEAHEKLKKAQKQIIQSEKLAAIGQLAAGIAHEINNPVSFVNSNLATLRKYDDALTELLGSYEDLKVAVESQETQKAREALSRIAKWKEQWDLKAMMTDLREILQESQIGVDRVRKIILDLRTFARSDKGTVGKEDLNQIVQGILNIVWNELKYKVDLKTEYGEISPVNCNAQEIGQVVINLLINAGQAIPEKGKVIVRTYAKGSEAYLEVSDTGTGISPENLEKIFDPFFTTKEPGKGTGLGLSICYDLIQRHGGRIEVESEVGKGTKFTVVLPVAG